VVVFVVAVAGGGCRFVAGDLRLCVPVSIETFEELIQHGFVPAGLVAGGTDDGREHDARAPDGIGLAAAWLLRVAAGLAEPVLLLDVFHHLERQLLVAIGSLLRRRGRPRRRDGRCWYRRRRHLWRLRYNDCGRGGAAARLCEHGR